MKSIREKFEEIWPVPDGVEWDETSCEYMPLDFDNKNSYRNAINHDAMLEVFTYCMENINELHIS